MGINKISQNNIQNLSNSNINKSASGKLKKWKVEIANGIKKLLKIKVKPAKNTAISSRKVVEAEINANKNSKYELFREKTDKIASDTIEYNQIKENLEAHVKRKLSSKTYKNDKKLKKLANTLNQKVLPWNNTLNNYLIKYKNEKLINSARHDELQQLADMCNNEILSLMKDAGYEGIFTIKTGRLISQNFDSETEVREELTLKLKNLQQSFQNNELKDAIALAKNSPDSKTRDFALQVENNLNTFFDSQNFEKIMSIIEVVEEFDEDGDEIEPLSLSAKDKEFLNQQLAELANNVNLLGNISNNNDLQLNTWVFM